MKLSMEQAIKILSKDDISWEEAGANSYEGFCELWDEAFDMAVDALKEKAEQESILDKIRAEIEQTRKIYLDMNDIDWLNGCDYVLSVIDKYKAESEEV